MKPTCEKNVKLIIIFIITEINEYLNSPKVLHKISSLTGTNIKGTTDIFISKFTPGDFLSTHNDTNLGRYAFIIYLNDNFTGGETEFPKHNYKAKPKIGKGVLFFNLNDDNTDRRINSFHGGLPPNTGEKWMCNKWIRLKPIKNY